MQDTPNSYLEVEIRDLFLGIFGRGLGRNVCGFVSFRRFLASIAALPLRSCRHALGMISLFVFALAELFPVPPWRNESKSIAPAIYFEACRFLTSAACVLERRFADVYMGDMSEI